ncbi:MAG TPA: hypothetical protein PLI43_14030 [Albidovulum sp.]|uniref:hypothetical protein n=1 Tax=Albidovulum sp. TaxID=1872424 RepID=UPI002CFB7EEF|nr:hypothetical protein [Albidovulum sp.]
MVGDQLWFRFRGDFAVLTEDERNIAPSGKKAIGVLAMLAESDTMHRSRRWLEDKLWSDRGQAQASGSLRTTLYEIRSSFGPAADVVGSDRNAIWLDRAMVRTDLASPARDREFLEGLDIADPEFNDWLVQKRLQYGQENETAEPRPENRGRIAIQCGTPWTATSSRSALSQILDDQVGKIISGFIALSHCTVGERKPDLVVRTTTETTDEGACIFAQIIEAASGDIIHSDHCFTNDPGVFLRSQEALGRFCWGIADAALERLTARDAGNSPAALRASFVQGALRDVLSFEAAQMRNSLARLDNAVAHLKSGLFPAMKAWALMSLIMEGFHAEDATMRDQIRSLLRRAIEISPEDGMVAAVSANVYVIMLQDYDRASSLARRALHQNPTNIFALQALSLCRAKEGDFDTAYRLSNCSRVASSLSKFEGMCNLHHALVCINLRRLDEAAEAASRAIQVSPQYRAPRRQLIALKALNEDPAAALGAVTALTRIEPEFELERYLFDSNYPATTLRKNGYLRAAGQRLGFSHDTDES